VNDKDYQVPFAFNGKINNLTIKLGPMQFERGGRDEKHGKATARSARLGTIE